MTDQEQLRVLIADDDAGMRTVMRKIIAKVEGFTLVAEAGDGKTTLELTEQLKPNVVFLDVEMPRLGGFGAAERIRGMCTRHTGHGPLQRHHFRYGARYLYGRCF